MQIVAALSTLSTPSDVAQQLESQLKSKLKSSPDVLLVFISYALADSFHPIVAAIRDAMAPANLLAVIGESVIGLDQEVERTPAVSALAIAAPGTQLHAFHLAEDQWQDLLSDREFFTQSLAGDLESPRTFLMFGDPYTTPIVQLLNACTQVFPTSPVIGGMASGMQGQGDTRLALNDDIHTSGLVGIALAGNIEVNCVVSQGCRPVGETFTVTKGHQNVVEQLDGKPALVAIDEMVQEMSLHDRQLMQMRGLQVGRVIDEAKGNFGRGDFLIRSLVGVKRETGAVLIGDHVRAGQSIKFHVRDAITADEEMRLLLEGETMLGSTTHLPAGALLITCNGRGTRLFDMPHHDVSLVRQILGDIPVAGFFAAGELGPVGDKNFIHGYTAVLAIFRQPSPQ